MATGVETVIVMSKLPHALRITQGADHKGHPIIIDGVNTVNPSATVNIHDQGLAAKTVLTKEQWDEVLRNIGESEVIKNGIIWTVKSESDAVASAKDKRKQKTGFEPVDPNAKEETPAGKVEIFKED
ncbi:MAG: hypothetical protein HGA87_00330 [Desulfobulbaceae bacterium]|nr:hypothetical protein [Desulfobulbaceae bacterium]